MLVILFCFCPFSMRSTSPPDFCFVECFSCRWCDLWDCVPETQCRSLSLSWDVPHAAVMSRPADPWLCRRGGRRWARRGLVAAHWRHHAGLLIIKLSLCAPFRFHLLPHFPASWTLLLLRLAVLSPCSCAGPQQPGHVTVSAEWTAHHSLPIQSN